MMLQSRLHRSVDAYKKIEWLIIAMFFGWLAYSLFFGERIPEANGNGYDGEHYATIAQQFSSLVFHHQLSIYSLQRILPSGIIYVTAHLLNIQLAIADMPFAFSVYNTILLAFAVIIWNKIANYLHWTPPVRLITFSGLFLNYAILKMNTYYPVLTDTSAFVCALLMLYFFLMENKYGVLFTAIAGAFIFPTLLYVGLILFVFSTPTKVDTNSHLFSGYSKASLVITLIKTVLIVSMAFITYKKIGVSDGFALGRYPEHFVLYISFLTLFVYLFLAMRPIYHRHEHIFLRLLVQSVNARLLIAIVIVMGMRMLLHYLSNGEPGPLTPLLFIEVIIMRSLAYPAIFLVSHIIYFGPIVCLLMYFWNDVIQYLKERACGLFVVTGCYIILSIDSESRQIINFLPIAVIALAQVLNTKALNWNFTCLFVISSFILSRVWLPLSHGWVSIQTNPPTVMLQFPLQWYFMSQAPWMSQRMYVIFLLVAIVTFGLIFLLANNLMNPKKQQIGQS